MFQHFLHNMLFSRLTSYRDTRFCTPTTVTPFIMSHICTYMCIYMNRGWWNRSFTHTQKCLNTCATFPSFFKRKKRNRKWKTESKWVLVRQPQVTWITDVCWGESILSCRDKTQKPRIFLLVFWSLQVLELNHLCDRQVDTSTRGPRSVCVSSCLQNSLELPVYYNVIQNAEMQKEVFLFFFNFVE